MFLWYTFLFINKKFCQLLVPKHCQPEFFVKPEMEATLGALCFNIGGIKEPHFFIYYRI
jgi:hypothetical protein